MSRIALLSCSCTMQTILRTCAVTKTDQIGGKLTLVLERGKGSGLLGLLSRGKGSGRAEDGSEAGDSLHLGKSSIQQNWGGRRRQRKAPAEKTACGCAHPSPRSLLQFGKLPAYLCQKHQTDIIKILRDRERLSVRPYVSMWPLKNKLAKCSRAYLGTT